MGDFATLLTAIGGLATALAGAVATVVTALRAGRRERAAADADRIAALEAELAQLREKGPGESQ
ncbi:hypothetical protein [Saccharopolyspora sp. NPDC002376]